MGQLPHGVTLAAAAGGSHMACIGDQRALLFKPTAALGGVHVTTRCLPCCNAGSRLRTLFTHMRMCMHVATVDVCHMHVHAAHTAVYLQCCVQ
jgi:hypothetical protein